MTTLFWRASLLPFTLAIFEFLLFSILLPPGSFYLPSDAPNTLWNHWHLIFALFAINASILVWNRKRQLKRDDFDSKLHGLIGELEGWLKRDIKGAAITGGLWIIIWALMTCVLLPRYRWVQMWHWLLAIPALAIMISVIYLAERDRKTITSHLTGEGSPQSKGDGT